MGEGSNSLTPASCPPTPCFLQTVSPTTCPPCLPPTASTSFPPFLPTAFFCPCNLCCLCSPTAPYTVLYPFPTVAFLLLSPPLPALSCLPLLTLALTGFGPAPACGTIHIHALAPTQLVAMVAAGAVTHQPQLLPAGQFQVGTGLELE